MLARLRLLKRGAAIICAATLLFWWSAARGAAQENNAATTGAAQAQGQTPAPARRDKATEGARGTTPAAAANGLITGRVVGDGGEPLASVLVYLFQRNWSGAPRQPAATVTDEDGVFRFDNLDAGVYTISANAPAYINDSEAQDGAAPRYYRIGDSADIRLVKGGVITGSVTGANGGPAVAAYARAFRVRKPDGQPASDFFWIREMPTDDRGVFRIYGLLPGVYLVSAGGNRRNPGVSLGAYDADAPTYFPSGAQDGASEITVHAGQEVAGVDIRHRGEQGHAVRGGVSLSEPPGDEFSINVNLSHAASGMPLGTAFVNPREKSLSFSFDGLADGEYEAQARYYSRNGAAGASPPQRIIIRGADVTGLKLALAPFDSLNGKIVAQPLRDDARAASGCAERRSAFLPQEMVLTARRIETDGAQPQQPQPRKRPPFRAEAAPDDGGDFTFRNLEPGRFHVGARPLDENWYVRAVELKAATATGAQAATGGRAPRKRTATTGATPPAAPQALVQANDGFDIKPGQQLSGVTVLVAEGAAGLNGRLITAGEAGPAPLAPTLLRVHLIPATREQADDLPRYAEAVPSSDGSFSFRNIAPGRYLILAREAESATERSAAWDSAARARLRREAEAAKVSLELQSCRRVNDFALTYSPAK